MIQLAIITLTSDNFNEIITGNPVVLVDFWAEWCGPCRMLSPIIDEIAEENADITIGKVNVDEEIELAQQFGVMSIPMIAVFKNGELEKTSLGLKPKEALLELVL